MYQTLAPAYTCYTLLQYIQGNVFYAEIIRQVEH